MARDGSNGRKPDHRAFRPTLDGRLEPRLLMAARASGSAFVGARTAAGGQAVIVTLASKERFYISVINGGTVRAVPATRGRVGLVVEGSSVDTLLTINPILQTGSVASTNTNTNTTSTSQQTIDAHTFRTPLSRQNRLLNVASIRVSTGTIGSIEGYRDTILSGPVVVRGPNRVDRIALASIARGGSITVGGDLNTLDVLNDANFDGGAGLNVGRDLNFFSVGGNLRFQNGANGNVARDVGLVPQAAKGTGPSGQGIFVNGDFVIGPNSLFTVGRSIDAPVIINGNFLGFSRFLVNGVPLLDSGSAGLFRVRGGLAP